ERPGHGGLALAALPVLARTTRPTAGRRRPAPGTRANLSRRGRRLGTDYQRSVDRTQGWYHAPGGNGWDCFPGTDFLMGRRVKKPERLEHQHSPSHNQPKINVDEKSVAFQAAVDHSTQDNRCQHRGK